MRICVITDDKNSYSSRKFLKEAKLNGIKLFFAKWNDVVFYSDKNSILLKGNFPLKSFDAVILRSSITSLTPTGLIVEYCNQNNIRLLNNDFYLRYHSADKLNQQIIFQTKKIPCLQSVFWENISFSLLKKELGVPFIAKMTKGSLGKQVFKINSQKEFKQFVSKSKKEKKSYIFQKFYKISGDYRVFVIGKEIFGPMKRIAPKGEWRTNMQGATHERASEEKQVVNFARIFSRKIKLDFVGLDILIDSSGKLRIIELNTMACFKVFDEVYPEINIARKTIELLKNKA